MPRIPGGRPVGARPNGGPIFKRPHRKVPRGPRVQWVRSSGCSLDGSGCARHRLHGFRDVSSSSGGLAPN
eukprot:11190109-Lingulodinium_polyedra.AAC.1